MKRRRLLWQLYPLYLAATVLALTVIAVYAMRSFERSFREQTAAELEDTARMVGLMLADLPSPLSGRTVGPICREAGKAIAKRITVILPSGAVVGESEESPAEMENHSGRPEIAAALSGATGVALRRSRTLDREMMYVALPLSRGGETVAVVRASMPVKALTDVMHRLDARIALEAALVALCMGGIVFLLSRRMIKPLDEIRRGAQRFRDGDLSYRIRVRGPSEIASLAGALNHMAAELSTRMERLRQLEDMRREFVANVSHELKTPVTSIRGFAETLRDGVEADPRLAKQYLGIIAAQAGRLSSIIEDLLQLSRIEEEMRGSGLLERERVMILPVLNAAAGMLASAAKDKFVRIDVACDEELSSNINAHLVEQAVANLIDNAVKYGGEGKSVRVEGSSEGKELLIRVMDEGPGIPAEHLPRIFERFYRVDKGRSRKLGGTGLGLAIVKHIAGLHGGSVSVESEMGRGSTFTIRLPL